MSNEAKQQSVESALRLAPVVPVVIIEDASKAVGMARALVAGGVPAIEVTLRTPAALDAVRAIAAEVEGAFVGVGTVLTARDLENAFKAGAKFAVSPGSSPRLLDAADDHELPLLPGAATSSEAMALLERGYRFQKFFPSRTGRRPEVDRRLGQPSAADPFLSYWRYQLGQRAGLPLAAQCRVRGWLVAHARQASRDVRLGGHRSPGARGGAVGSLSRHDLSGLGIAHIVGSYRVSMRWYVAWDRPHRGLLPGASMRWGRQPLRWCRRL